MIQSTWQSIKEIIDEKILPNLSLQEKKDYGVVCKVQDCEGKVVINELCAEHHTEHVQDQQFKYFAR